MVSDCGLRYAGRRNKLESWVTEPPTTKLRGSYSSAAAGCANDPHIRMQAAVANNLQMIRGRVTSAPAAMDDFKHFTDEIDPPGASAGAPPSGMQILFWLMF